MSAWTIEYEGEAFERFVNSLPEYEQAVLIAAIENVLQIYGVEICSGEWGKPLGGGLFEFRVRKSLRAIGTEARVPERMAQECTVLLRVFCTFYGNKIVLLYHGYDKKKDPSAKRQQREIAKARKLHNAWKQRR